MLKIALAFYLIWQLVVVIYQYSEALRQRLDGWAFYLCGLLPTWQMFGPRPVDGDYRLYFRTRPGDEGIFCDWRPVDHARKATIVGGLFFHPQAHLVKSMRDICVQVCLSQSEYNVYYQLLLQYVIGVVRLQIPAKQAGEPQLQFRIDWRTPGDLQPIYYSHVHAI
jgi:hypothetical protein